MPIQGIGRHYQSGPLFVQKQQTDLTPFGKPPHRSGNPLQRHSSRVQDAMAADSNARRSSRAGGASSKNLAISRSSATRVSRSKAKRRRLFTLWLSDCEPLVRLTSANISSSKEKVLVRLMAVRIPTSSPIENDCRRIGCGGASANTLHLTILMAADRSLSGERL